MIVAKMPESSHPVARHVRLPYLDVLRCAAILLVLGNHQFVSPASWQWGYSFFTAWQRGGWVGVDLFFCLSGFLIGGLLFSELKHNGRINIRRFYIRRTFKIWPSYLVYVLAILGFQLVIGKGSLCTRLDSVFRLLWPSFFHIQNYLGAPYGHTWSLAVEEHFYLILPILVGALLWWNAASPHHPMRGLAPVSLLIAIACLAARIWTAAQHDGFSVERNTAPTHLRLDGLLAGVALSYLAYFRPQVIAPLARWRFVLLVAGAFCFVPAFVYSRETAPFTYTYGLSMNSIGAIGITLYAWFASCNGTAQRSSSALIRGMALIGSYSYSIYLWHLPFAWSPSVRIWRQIVPEDWPLAHLLLMLMYIVVACAIGTVMYRIVEKPALLFRDRAFPSNGRPVVALPVSLASPVPVAVAGQIGSR